MREESVKKKKCWKVLNTRGEESGGGEIKVGRQNR